MGVIKLGHVVRLSLSTFDYQAPKQRNLKEKTHHRTDRTLPFVTILIPFPRITKHAKITRITMSRILNIIRFISYQSR